MATYTPGLLVTPHTRYRVRRLLPIPGEVRAAVGQNVAARDVVAATQLPGDVFPMNLAALIGVPPGDLPDCMLVREGDAVAEGDVLARSPGIFGLMRTEAKATAAGTIESVSDVSGQVIVRGPSIPVEVDAYVAGTVARVVPDQGVDIEADVAQVQGIFGIGGETAGPIVAACGSPDDPLTPDRVRDHAKPGAVLVGGARITREAVAAAVEAGVAALVSGGIDDADLKSILGYDLGVAVTGTEKIGLTLIVTEGFGDIAMAARTFDLITSHAGREASVNGTTQIRAGVLRPEIVIPLTPDSWSAGANRTGPRTDSTALLESPDSPATPEDFRSAADDSAASADVAPALQESAGDLATGAPLRIIRDPYFGVLGTVAELPHEPQVLESGSKARVLVVATQDGRRVTVPRANVELIEGAE